MDKQAILPLVSISQNPRRSSECVLVYRKVPNCSIEFQHPEIGSYTFSGEDLFECLCDLRDFLEDRDWYIVCNGSRIDAYTSGMARQMSGGEKIYLHNSENINGNRRTVNLFGATDPDKVSNVAEQLAYYETWRGKRVTEEEQ
jgi:hypothetical protein